MYRLFVKRYLIFNTEPDHGKAACIVLSQKITPLTCPVRRLINLEEQYKYYKLSKPQNTILKYPEETKNLFDSISFPLLNHETPSVLFRSATRSDLHETNWLIHYVGMAIRNDGLASKVSKEERYYTSYKDFANLLADIRRNQTNDLVSIQIPGLQTVCIDKIDGKNAGCFDVTPYILPFPPSLLENFFYFALSCLFLYRCQFLLYLCSQFFLR